MDNLDSQCQPEYLMSEECQTDDHKVHALPSLAVNHRAALRTSRHATRQPSHLPLRCCSRRRTACESRLLAHPGASRQDRPDAASGRRAQAADQNLHGQEEEDEWLEDDTNLQKWESNELTASDRRILLAQWHCKAMKAAFVVL